MKQRSYLELGYLLELRYYPELRYYQELRYAADGISLEHERCLDSIARC